VCGIAGYITNRPVANEVLDQMVESLRHRGPDSKGIHRSGSYAGGMRRLSINGIETGDQPLYNKDSSVVVFYNGEIYNYQELKRDLEARGYQFKTGSDGEVICHLYDEHGIEAFSRLDGMFAIAVWSEIDKKLILVRDLPGEKPLYYSELPAGGIVFGSELRVFKYFPALSLSLDYQALWDFPSFLWIPEPNTVYKEVKAVPKGYYLVFDESGCNLQSFPNRFADDLPDISSWDDLVDLTRKTVTDAVRSRLLSEVPVGSFLSSGLDSSIISTIAQQELGNLTTFSIGFENIHDPYHGNADESSAAKEYSKHIGTKHYEIRVTANDFRDELPTFCEYADQPFGVSSGLGILFVAKAARERGIKTLLSGDGADELFGGYSWYEHLASPLLSQNHDVYEYQYPVSFQNFGLSIENRLKVLANYSGPRRAWAWHYYAAEEEKRRIFSKEIFAEINDSNKHFSKFNPDLNWQPQDFIRQDRDFYLHNEMMRKLDRMTMAYSVEGRAPFVAPVLLGLANKLDYKHMIKGSVLKPVLRMAFSGLLPEDVKVRPKHGFNVPIDHWLKGDWRDLMEETFSIDSTLSKNGLISKDAAVIARDMILNKERLNGHTIFCYIMLNMWLDQQRIG